MVKVLRDEIIAKGKLLCIRSAKLEFPNGKQVKHEYMDAVNSGRKSVITVPVDENGRILLVELYCTGAKKREVMCPTGLIDKSETPREAARRECQEEIGYKPKKLTRLGKVETSPGYSTHSTEVFLGTQLIPSKLDGDEPEELKVVKVKFSDLSKLMKSGKLMYAASIAALLMAEKKLKKIKQR